MGDEEQARASVEVRDQLGPDAVAEVAHLTAAAEATDGTPPLSDHVLLHLRHGGDRQARSLLQRTEDGVLVGYAHLDVTDRVEGPSAEVVVLPSARRRGYGGTLTRAVAQEAALLAPGSRLRLWSHGDSPAAARLAAHAGFSRARVLHQMRRALGRDEAALPSAPLPDGISVRTFQVGQDEAAWTELNNRAFAEHPDQGGWSAEEIRLREGEPWFDPAGFFLAERTEAAQDDGAGSDPTPPPRLVGFHWTKIHGSRPTGDEPAGHGHAALGEVYVVGVDPDERGSGLGRALTVLGLRHLAAAGLGQAMLYVDDNNIPAVRLYERLGFTRHLTDVSYRSPVLLAG